MTEFLENITFDELNVGDKASTERTLVEKDLILFAAVSGDVNPVHLDADYAANTPLKQRVAHGMWSASLISATLATVMPGPGSIYRAQTLKFSQPVAIGDRLTITLEVLTKHERSKKVELKCLVTNQDGRKVAEGVAEVLAPVEKIRVKRPVLPDIAVG